MIKYRIFIVILCLLFLMVSIRMAPKMCNASEMEKAQENHFHMAQGMNLNYYHMTHNIPFENGCSCSSFISPCCMGDINNMLENLHVSLLYRDILRQLFVLQTTMTNSFDYKPLSQKYRYLHDFNSLQQKDFFLVNCTFLI